MAASNWDQRYLEGSDRWELGRPAPPLEAFLRTDSRAPQPPGRVLVPGCGRGHEAALLADLGYEVTGLDFSSEAIQRAQALHGSDCAQLRWLQADLFDGGALAAAGITTIALTASADATPLGKVALTTARRLVVLGSGRDGLSDEVMQACTLRVRIEMQEGIDSLNVAAASAIACYTLRM